MRRTQLCPSTVDVGIAPYRSLGRDSRNTSNEPRILGHLRPCDDERAAVIRYPLRLAAGGRIDRAERDGDRIENLTAESDPACVHRKRVVFPFGPDDQRIPLARRHGDGGPWEG